MHPITTAIIALGTLAGGTTLYIRGTRPPPRAGWPGRGITVPAVAPGPVTAAPPHVGAGTVHAPRTGGAGPGWSTAGGATHRTPAGPAPARPRVSPARVPHTGVFAKGTGKPARAAPAPTHAKLSTGHHPAPRGAGHGKRR